MGFNQGASDPCLYVSLDSEGVIFLVAVYVDDIVLGGKIKTRMNAVKKELSQNFEMKDLGMRRLCRHNFRIIGSFENQALCGNKRWKNGNNCMMYAYMVFLNNTHYT